MTVVAGLVLVAAADAAPATGSVAPDFVLRSLVQGNHRLSEYRGDVVAVTFWAAWCGPCQQELPRLNELYERYRSAGLVVLGINLDQDAARARDMARTLGLGFPVLSDPLQQTGRLFEVDAMPMTVLIDREGRVRHVHGDFRADAGALYASQISELLDE